MITIQRTGQVPLEVDFLLIDFEGTLASDRRVHPKAKDKLILLSKRVRIYVVSRGDETAVSEVLRRVKAEVIRIGEGTASQDKLDLIRRLGASRTVAIGNGADDALMMAEAGLSICVIGREGASGQAVAKAGVVVTDVLHALDFLLKPLRHQSTLSI